MLWSFQCFSEAYQDPGEMWLPRGEGRGKQRGCPALLCPPQFHSEGSLHGARCFSHHMPVLLWLRKAPPCFPTAPVTVEQALFTLNYTSGLLPENMSFENGTICPFREEAYVWNMAGDSFLQPGWHKVITNPHEACSHSDHVRTPSCPGFKAFSQLRHNNFHGKTKERKGKSLLHHTRHRREHASNTRLERDQHYLSGPRVSAAWASKMKYEGLNRSEKTYGGKEGQRTRISTSPPTFQNQHFFLSNKMAKSLSPKVITWNACAFNVQILYCTRE